MPRSDPVTPETAQFPHYGATHAVTHSPHRSSTSDTLLPPDMNSIERRRRGCAVPISQAVQRRARMTLMCISVAASAVQANGVYCWPTYGPVVIRLLGLSTTQAQTIVVGGILGVYICAAPAGALVDRCGPRTGSLFSALVAALGYFSFAGVLVAKGRDIGDNGSGETYLALTACFFAVGAATVGSYFAALTTASLSFPTHPTLSLSVPLACMGLSSLFLSSFSALPIFHKDGELDPVRYLVFLGILCTSVNLFAAVFMRVVPPDLSCHHDADDSDSDTDDDCDYADLRASLHLDERSPLLIGGPEAAREEVEAQAHGKDVRWTVARLVRSPGFWLFGLVLSGCIGPSETIIATVGSIVTSVLPPDTVKLFLSAFSPSITTFASDTALSYRNKHVFILSIASTLSRLATGFAADYLAPAPVPVPSHSDDPHAPQHIFEQRKPIILRRSAFCALCSAALAGVFAWAAVYLDRESRLWVLSGGVGALYGAIFTLTPAIVSTHFGPTNFGLAWGMVSYFPALGSAVFGYIYASLAESAAGKSGDPTICYGTKCFQDSFWLAAGGCFLSALGVYLIGRTWRV